MVSECLIVVFTREHGNQEAWEWCAVEKCEIEAVKPLFRDENFVAYVSTIEGHDTRKYACKNRMLLWQLRETLHIEFICSKALRMSLSVMMRALLIAIKLSFYPVFDWPLMKVPPPDGLFFMTKISWSIILQSCLYCVLHLLLIVIIPRNRSRQILGWFAHVVPPLFLSICLPLVHSQVLSNLLLVSRIKMKLSFVLATSRLRIVSLHSVMIVIESRLFNSCG